MSVMSAKPVIIRGVTGLLVLSIGSMCWFASARFVATSASKPKNINATSLHSGDIIFRRGVSIESQAVIAMDGASTFSHVGIVLRQRDAVLVVHVVPGEGGADTTKIEPIEDFLRSDRASAARAYRVISENPSQIERAVEIAKDYAQRQIPFDKNFDLTSDDALYCTELVWRAYQKAGLDLVDGHLDESSSSLIRGPVLW